MDNENFIEKINCFVCKKQLKEQSDELFEDFFRSYEQHMLNNHQIIIPKFQSVDEFIDFLQQCISLDQLQSENRCQQFTFKKFDKIFNYFLIDKQQMSEVVIKKIVEKHFLEKILNESQKQRSDPNFSRMCLFCRKIFSENRSQLFDHLYNDHNFFIGHPDNIIDANEFLDILEEKLKKLLCLYCEREFKNWNVLKEHMRKKGHKTLNHNNREYDRFYLINYLCNDKHWKQIKKVNFLFLNFVFGYDNLLILCCRKMISTLTTLMMIGMIGSLMMIMIINWIVFVFSVLLRTNSIIFVNIYEWNMILILIKFLLLMIFMIVL